MTDYTNQTLADTYLRVASIDKDQSGIRKVRGVIASAPIDLSGYYQAHGSLADLPVRGIGPITISVLERILAQGEESAREIVLQERLANKRSRLEQRNRADCFSRYGKKGSDVREGEFSGYFDNAISTQER